MAERERRFLHFDYWTTALRTHSHSAFQSEKQSESEKFFVPHTRSSKLTHLPHTQTSHSALILILHSRGESEEFWMLIFWQFLALRTYSPSQSEKQSESEELLNRTLVPKTQNSILTLKPLIPDPYTFHLSRKNYPKGKSRTSSKILFLCG